LLQAIEEDQLRPRNPTASERSRFANAARETLLKNQRVDIRLSEHDLLGVKRRAAELGLPYQTLISGLIHQFVEGELVTTTTSATPQTQHSERIGQ
jgi:predicted DNA binding CopG/RHH family protein